MSVGNALIARELLSSACASSCVIMPVESAESLINTSIRKPTIRGRDSSVLAPTLLLLKISKRRPLSYVFFFLCSREQYRKSVYLEFIIEASNVGLLYF